MPTETHFSATDKLAILPMWVIDRIKEEMRLSPAAWQVIIAAVEQAEVPQTLPCEVKLPPGTVIGKGVPVSTLMLAIAQRDRYPVHARAFAEQPQGEPSAREAQALQAEKALGIERLPAEPSAPECATCNDEGAVGNILDTVPCPDCAAAPPVEHDDPVREALRAFVGAAYPVARQINERGYNWSEAYLDEALALARSALQHKPSPLVAQLQADLTERDQQIDALSMDAGRYRWLRSRDLETISYGGVFAGLTPDNLVLNEETLDHAIDAAMAKPKCRHCGDSGQIMVGRSGKAEDGNAPIMEPCEDCDRGMPDLASRPEERGTPESEPCSGCGTPGWTGACNKCVPY